MIAKYIDEFLRCCNAPTIGPSKKGHIAKAKNLVVAGLEVKAPGDAGHLWETLRNSGTVEKEFGIAKESPEEQKYLNALVETYWNTSCWETRRQVLSVMADLISFKRIQHYILGLTEYHFKMARHHALQYGHGAEVSMFKSPRLRIELTQLDHFLGYVRSSHVSQDIPFGQHHLRLSCGQVLETPNVICTMIPSRLVSAVSVILQRDQV